MLVPRYSLMSFSTAIDAMRIANRIAEREIYRWSIHSIDGEPVEASSHIVIAPNAGLQSATCPDIIFVCAGFDPHKYCDPALMAWLRRCTRHGSAVGGISTGTYIVAKAGLLEDYRCTIHWENAPGFREDFPHIDLTNSVYEVDRNRYTSTGGTSALDMMVYLFARDHGHQFARSVSNVAQMDRVRTQWDKQSVALKQSLRAKSKKLAAAIDIMETNLETPVTPEEISGTIGVTVRQLQRLFRQHTGSSPNIYYRDLRMERGRHLLLQTSLPVVDIAAAAGFRSHAHFSKCYREKYGHTPIQERNVNS